MLKLPEYEKMTKVQALPSNLLFVLQKHITGPSHKSRTIQQGLSWLLGPGNQHSILSINYVSNPDAALPQPCALEAAVFD